MIKILEYLQIKNESDDIDNKIFTPGSDDEKDYEQSQLSANNQILSDEEEKYHIRTNIETGPYNIKFNTGNYITNKDGQPKEFDLIGLRGFINTQIQHDNNHILNNMLIIHNNQEYTITQFNDLLEKHGIWQLNN